MSHATISGGRLFHSWAPAAAKVRSPTVEHCDWMTSSWSVSDDRRRRLDDMSDKRFIMTFTCLNYSCTFPVCWTALSKLFIRQYNWTKERQLLGNARQRKDKVACVNRLFSNVEAINDAVLCWMWDDNVMSCFCNCVVSTAVDTGTSTTPYTTTTTLSTTTASTPSTTDNGM